jgi:hypothetical protein
MVKVTLIEGFAAYVLRNGTIVMPRWDERGAQIVGECTVAIPGGARVVLKESARTVADNLEADLINPFGGLAPGKPS